MDNIFNSPLVLRLTIAATIMAILVISGTFIFAAIDNLTYGTAFYYTVQTLFSVGYGDIPITSDLGKVVSIIFMLFGIAVFLGSVTIVGTALIKQSTERTSRIENKIVEKREKKMQALDNWASRNNIDPELLERLKTDLRTRKKI